MKLMLTFLTIVFLSLALIACSGLPEAQKQSRSSIEVNPTLSQVVLEVSTIS